MNTSGNVRADAVGNEGRSQNSSRAWGGVADPMTRVSLVYEADHTACHDHPGSSPVLVLPAIMRWWCGGVGMWLHFIVYRGQVKFGIQNFHLSIIVIGYAMCFILSMMN